MGFLDIVGPLLALSPIPVGLLVARWSERRLERDLAQGRPARGTR